MSLAVAIRRGAFWIYVGQGYGAALSFGSGVVLARLLAPDEFGVFIAVSAFTSVLLVIVQFGLGQALVQRQQLVPPLIHGAFWTVLLLALAGALIAAIAAQPLAKLFADERFAGIMLAMGGLFLFMPYTAIGLALLRRQMRYGRVVALESASATVASGAAVIAARLGYGPYALVWGAFASMLTIACALPWLVNWLPRPTPLKAVRPLLSYAWYAMLNGLLNSAASRVDNMLIGGLLGVGGLGIYNRAYSLARIPSDHFAESLNPLLLAGLARVQDDARQTRAIVLTGLSAIALLTLPLLGLLVILGPLAVELVYGQAWAAAGPPLQVMVAGGAFLVLSVTLRSLANARGLVRELAGINLLVTLLTVVVVVGLARHGLLWVALGISLRELVLLLALLRVTGKAVPGLGLWQVLLAVAPALVAAGLGMLIGAATMAWWPAALASSRWLEFAVVSAAMLASDALVLVLLLATWRRHQGLQAVRAMARAVLLRWTSAAGG